MSITLYLCRHALAAEAHGAMTDADRPLTAEGAKKFWKTARGFIRLAGAENLTHIFSSPLLRARQTAEILSESLAHARHEIPVQIHPALGPPGDLKRLLKDARHLQKTAGIIAVGHEPLLSRWIGELCFDHPGRVEMKKGALAALDITTPKAQLLWLMQPAMLRDL